VDESITAYLAALGAPDPVVRRAEWAFEAFAVLSPEPIERVFVSDSFDDTKNERTFDSVCAFGRRFWLQSRDFLIDDNADVALYANAVTYVGIESKDLVFSEGSGPTSRLKVEIETGGDLYTPLSAVGGNCDRLLEIIRERLVPNLRSEV